MKIGSVNDAAATAAAVAATKAERGTAPGVAATETASAGVPVTVSAAARSLDIPAGSGIDEAKVASVRAAIADGTFTTDSGAIADKLLANAQELLSRTRS